MAGLFGLSRTYFPATAGSCAGAAASGLPGGAVEAGAPGAVELAPQPAASTASSATAIATGLRGVRMGDKLQNERGPGRAAS